MAIVPRSTIKVWFQRLKKPTQEQFWDWIDSYWHKNDSIPTSSVDGLDGIIAGLPSSGQLDAIDALAPAAVTVSGTGTYTVPAGKVLQYIVCTGSGTALVGTSAGGEQLANQPLGAGPATITINQYTAVSVQLHFTGNFTALIYMR